MIEKENHKQGNCLLTVIVTLGMQPSVNVQFQRNCWEGVIRDRALCHMNEEADVSSTSAFQRNSDTAPNNNA